MPDDQYQELAAQSRELQARLRRMLVALALAEETLAQTAPPVHLADPRHNGHRHATAAEMFRNFLHELDAYTVNR